MRRLLFVAATAAALVASTALAATSAFNGTYKGRTSQGYGITVKVKVPASFYAVNGQTTLHFKCASSKPVTERHSSFYAKLSSRGRFSGGAAGGDRGYDFVISGSISGKRASGTMHASFFAHASSTGFLSDKCNTGKVTFSALR